VWARTDGRLSSQRRSRRGWGIERDLALVDEAATRLTNVVSVDLEGDPIAGLPIGHFDVIVYADVLEHLVDPWTVLSRQRSLLRPGGLMVASIPNVRHIRVTLPLLLRGRWDYTDEGLLSRGHVRFFTTRSMRQMITGAGYRINREGAGIAPKAQLVSRLSLGRLDDLLVRDRLFVATST